MKQQVSHKKENRAGLTLRVLLFAALFLVSSIASVATTVQAGTEDTSQFESAPDDGPRFESAPDDGPQLQSVPDAQGTSRPVDSLPSFKGHPVISGYCDYLASSSSGDSRERFFYSDGYFEESAAVYDPQLATMSLCLAGASMATAEGGTIDYKNKSVNARELLDHIGCTDIAVNADFVVKPGEDTIGVVLGQKQISVGGRSCTLIPIGIRGAGYESEWIGNMKIGDTGDAKGFYTAAKHAKDIVDAYLREYAIDTERVKFWIAGFSRAGAVTDLLTHMLTDEYDPSGASVYGYSFATPQGAYEKSRSYPNSHCTLNRVDVVPMVAPSYMGFSHYGDDTVVDEPDESGAPFQAYRIKVYYAMDNFIATVPSRIEFEPVASDMQGVNDVVGGILDALQSTVAPDRNTFSNTLIEGEASLESIFSWLLRLLMTSSEEHIEGVADAITGFQERLGMKSVFKLSEVVDAVRDGLASMDQEDRDDIYGTLWGWFGESLRASLTTEEYEDLASMWKAFIYTLIEVAHYDYVHSGSEGFTLIGSLIKNADAIARAHAPETYFRLLKKKDSNYRDISDRIAGEQAAFRLEDAGHINAVIYKKQSPVAVLGKGRLKGSKDPSVYTAGARSGGSDLQPNAEGSLYHDVTTDSPDAQATGDIPEYVRTLMVNPRADYEIELTPDDAPEGLEFYGWTDEKGLILTHEETLLLQVNYGTSYHRLVRPVYRKPVPEESEGEEGTGAGEPGSGRSEEPGGGAAWWIIGGLAVAAAAGGGGFFLWRRRKTL